MRRCIPIYLLLGLVILSPTEAHSQTRFYDRGDTGVSAAIDFVWVENYGNRFDYQWGAHAAFTYEGIFDVGGGFQSGPSGTEGLDGPKYLFANIALIQPGYMKNWGLEFGGQYTTFSVDQYRYYSFGGREWYRAYSTFLRGFFRNTPGNLIVGLGGVYSFRKNQVLDIYDDVLYGHDYGEVGFDLDLHYLVGNLVPLSLNVFYSQNNQYSFLEDWQFTFVLSTGFLFGLNSEPEGDPHAR